MWQNLQLHNPVSRKDFSDDSTAEDVQSAKRFLLTCFKSDKKRLASLAGAEATVLVRQSIPGTGNEAHWAFVGIEIRITAKQKWPWAAGEPLEGGWKRLLVARAANPQENAEPEEKHSVQPPKPQPGSAHAA